MRKGSSEDEFRAYSYMVEVYWLAVVRAGVRGVIVYMTTGASNRSGRIDDWEVFFLSEVTVGSILGYTTGEPLGLVRNVHGMVYGYRHMIQFLTNAYRTNVPHHAWAGYSQNTFTLDDLWHAVDWYWQSPQELMSGWYNHFVLVDVNEPSQWYQAKCI